MPPHLAVAAQDRFVIINDLEVIRSDVAGLVTILFDGDEPRLPPYDRYRFLPQRCLGTLVNMDSDEYNDDPKAAIRPLIGARGFYLHPLDRKSTRLNSSH